MGDHDHRFDRDCLLILDMSLMSIIYGYLGGGVFGAMVAIIGSLLVHETRHDAG